MFRNDVVMTPLRVKRAIDSRFVKPSEDELNVLINGTWVGFVTVGGLPPPINCAELLTMYKGDLTLTETPVINATGCTSMVEVFRGCKNLKTVNYIHAPNVTSMNGVFRGCSSLTSIPEIDTSNVTDMCFMFRGCSSLTSIPEIDTSSVTNADNMTQMFSECSSLTSVTFVGGVVSPYEVNMFIHTPIKSGNGNIFVPDNLVAAYKAASGWSTHASIIKGISEKP